MLRAFHLNCPNDNGTETGAVGLLKSQSVSETGELRKFSALYHAKGHKAAVFGLEYGKGHGTRAGAAGNLAVDPHLVARFKGIVFAANVQTTEFVLKVRFVFEEGLHGIGRRNDGRPLRFAPGIQYGDGA